MSSELFFSQPEVSPAISCEASLGQFVARVEIDSTYFANLLQQLSPSDSDTTETSIILTNSDEVGDVGVELPEDGSLAGSYNPVTKTTRVNIGRICQELNKDEFALTRTKEDLGHVASLLASRFAVHEASHRGDHVTLGRDGLDDELFEYLAAVLNNASPDKQYDPHEDRLLIALDSGQLFGKLDEETYHNKPDEIRADTLASEQEYYYGMSNTYPIRIWLK